ncbi:Venom dipeptidyl peptidase 4 [Chionoecetes opilio]|uniref:Venom dipeptidyl peptidase 4 n=1 Tax=Chionoecetes opilio TaxID=41210 RepID=A0A8J5CKP9_CHIOP|nr:Venom dipeptidyl peptidase 4 [Chionoecetes opilio]
MYRGFTRGSGLCYFPGGTRPITLNYAMIGGRGLRIPRRQETKVRGAKCDKREKSNELCVPKKRAREGGGRPGGPGGPLNPGATTPTFVDPRPDAPFGGWGFGGYVTTLALWPPRCRRKGFNPWGGRGFPYAAPGSQAVTTKMRFSWGTYLASKKNIIYAMIDGRGSGFQGDKIKREVYHELGGKEVDDQVAVARYLRDNLHFVDPRRIAIWGWSYGGYVTTMALARDADDVFTCGVAVAPVARWEHYDSVYTERYMGSPHVYPGSNYKGYEAADATKVVGNLKGKMFLLVHGTADDNVHYHHSMMLAKALVDEGVLFQQMTYADENHGLTDVKEHLYRTLDKFLADCYRPTIRELYFLIKKKKKDLEEIGYL